MLVPGQVLVLVLAGVEEGRLRRGTAGRVE